MGLREGAGRTSLLRGRQTDRQTTEINRSPRERVGYQSRLAKTMMTMLVAAVLVVLSALVGTAGAERTLMQFDYQIIMLMAEDTALFEASKAEVDDMAEANHEYIESEMEALDDVVEANHEYIDSELEALDDMIEEELEEVLDESFQGQSFLGVFNGDCYFSGWFEWLCDGGFEAYNL